MCARVPRTMHQLPMNSTRGLAIVPLLRRGKWLKGCASNTEVSSFPDVQSHPRPLLARTCVRCTARECQDYMSVHHLVLAAASNIELIKQSPLNSLAKSRHVPCGVLYSSCATGRVLCEFHVARTRPSSIRCSSLACRVAAMVHSCRLGVRMARILHNVSIYPKLLSRRVLPSASRTRPTNATAIPNTKAHSPTTAGRCPSHLSPSSSNDSGPRNRCKHAVAAAGGCYRDRAGGSTAGGSVGFLGGREAGRSRVRAGVWSGQGSRRPLREGTVSVATGEEIQGTKT